MVCPVGIECDHGYDVCPVCDPCTCSSVLPDRKILPVVDGQPLTPTERYVLGRPAPGDGIYVVLW